MPTKHAQQPVAANDFATAPASGLPLLSNGKTQLEAMNEIVLRQYIPDLVGILKIAPYTVVYTFSPETQQWEKSGCEGSMFLCRRSHLQADVFVLNRKSMENFRIELKTPDDIEITSEYIIMQSTREDGTPEIYGLWFHNAQGQTSKEEMGTEIIAAATTAASAAQQSTQGHHGDVTLGLYNGMDYQKIEPPERMPQSGAPIRADDTRQLGGNVGGQGQSIDLLQFFSKPQVQPETHINTAQNTLKGQQVDLLRLFGRSQSQALPAPFPA